jgi:uroporphyrin-III C-methyltransferase
MIMTKGNVYLVGAGPGDPKLITVYGLECIQKSDVILYDRLVNKQLLNHAKADAELIFCGKLPGKHEMIQEQIHELLVEKALEGKIVTRLKGGDPCVFGRVGEEAEVLAENHIKFEIVPGITSGIAAPAYAGIPVTHRDFASSFAIVTGHGRAEKQEDNLNWASLAQGIDTIAFYMGAGNLNHICKKLSENGKSEETPVAVIHWGTTEKQKTIIGTLKTIEKLVKQAGIKHPSIIIVGEVVNLRQKLKWFEEMDVIMDEQKEEEACRSSVN